MAQEDGTDKMTAVDEFKACKSMVEAPAGTRPAGGIRVNEVRVTIVIIRAISLCHGYHVSN